MSVQPSLVALARQRTAPPAIPPVVDKSEFDDDEAYAAYMKTRRKAKERVREFNRPPRGSRKPSHSSPLASAIKALRTREHRILFHCDVETGRKKSPTGAFQPRRPARERHEEDAKLLPKLTSAQALHKALLQEEEHAGTTLSQVRRAVTAANTQADPHIVELGRQHRRSISKALSATRPAVYPARLASKREAEREARGPQKEARRLKRVERAARRDADVRVARWAYELCCQEEQQARALDADDLWYLRERRLDAGSALRIASGRNETPRWELRRARRGPVYRRLTRISSSRRQRGPRQPAECDSDEERLAELIRDYGPQPAKPQPATPQPAPAPQDDRPRCLDCGNLTHHFTNLPRETCTCLKRVVATWTLVHSEGSLQIPIREPCKLANGAVCARCEADRLRPQVPVCEKCGAWNVEAGVCVDRCGQSD